MTNNQAKPAGKDIYFYKRQYLERLRASEQGVEGALKIAHDLRKFEIDLYWKRSTNFWTFVSVVLAGYGALLLGAAKDGVYEDPIYSYIIQLALFVLASLGAVLSFAWVRVNQGGKFWQQNWETQVDMIEDEAVGPVTKTIFAKSKKRFDLVDNEIRRDEIDKLTVNLRGSGEVGDRERKQLELELLLKRIDLLDKNYWSNFRDLNFRKASKKTGEFCFWPRYTDSEVADKVELSEVEGFPSPEVADLSGEMTVKYGDSSDNSVGIYSTSGINKIVSWIFFGVFAFLVLAGLVLMVYKLFGYFGELDCKGGGGGCLLTDRFFSIEMFSCIAFALVLFLTFIVLFVIERAKTSTSIDNFYNISYRRADVSDDLTKVIRKKHINR